MRLLLSLAILTFTTLNGAAATIGPQHLLSPASIGPAIGNQARPALATDGENSLIAWQDDHPGRPGVYVALLDSNGVLITGSQRCLREAGVQSVSLAWTGNEYLAVWSNRSNMKVEAIVLDRSGAPQSPVRVVADDAIIDRGALAVMGDRALVVVSSIADGCKALLLDRDQRPLRELVLPQWASTKVVAAAGEFYVFGFDFDARPASASSPLGRESVIAYRRVSVDGDFLDSAPMVVNATGSVADGYAVAARGEEVAVAAVGVNGTADLALRTFVMNTVTGQTKELPSQKVVAYDLALAALPDAFVVSWSSYESAASYELLTKRFTATTAGQSVLASGDRGAATDVSSIWNGTRLIVAFTDRSESRINGAGSDVFATTLDDNGSTLLAPHAVALSPRWQSQPVIAANGVQRYAAWLEQTNDGTLARLVGVSLAPDDEPSSEPRLLSEGFTPSYGKIDIAAVGDGFIIVWEEFDGGEPNGVRLVHRFIARDGTPEPALHVIGYGNGPAIAANAAGALIVYGTAAGIVALPLDIRGEPLRADGLLIAAGGRRADVATNGSTFLAVWEEGSDYWQFPSPNMIDVRGVRLTNSATALDAAPIDIAATAQNENEAAVASNGTDYLVALTTGGRYSTPAIATKCVRAAGTVEPSTRFVDQGNSYAIARSGDGYIIGWIVTSSVPFSTASIRILSLEADGLARGDAVKVADELVLGTTRPYLSESWFRQVELVYSEFVPSDFGPTLRAVARTVRDEHSRRRPIR
jgi:hypothetical protein